MTYSAGLIFIKFSQKFVSECLFFSTSLIFCYYLFIFTCSFLPISPFPSISTFPSPALFLTATVFPLLQHWCIASIKSPSDLRECTSDCMFLCTGIPLKFKMAFCWCDWTLISPELLGRHHQSCCIDPWNHLFSIFLFLWRWGLWKSAPLGQPW